MNKKAKKTGEILAIVCASLGVVVALSWMVIFSSNDQLAVMIGPFLFALIIFILTIIFCAIDLAHRDSVKMTSFIFILLSLAFTLYIDTLIKSLGQYGYFYPIMKVGFVVSSILLYKTIFGNNVVRITNDQGQAKQIVTEKPFNALEELDKIYSLKERNLITEEEYNAKRAEIVDKM